MGGPLLGEPRSSTGRGSCVISDSCAHKKPETDQLEVSLFGPGFGESILVHIPGGQWFVIDSCPDAGATPVALRYLEGMGVDAAGEVSLIVASHWHWDHVRGISALVKACSSAEVFISAALATRDLFAFAHASQYMASAPKAVKELYETAKYIQESPKSRVLNIAQGRLPLHHSSHNGINTVVTALSPSAASVSAAISSLANARIEPNKPLVVPREYPNDAAIALQIVVGEVSLLLGSDLENHTDPARGWAAAFDDAPLPRKRSHLLKVAHHGSENGDAELIWSQMLHDEPVALLTHFHNGNVHLPRPEILERLAQRSRLYSTSGAAWTPSDTAPDPGEAVRALFAVDPLAGAPPRTMGHIRARTDPASGGDWDIDVCGAACRVESLTVNPRSGSRMTLT